MSQKEFETIAAELRRQILAQAQTMVHNCAEADDIAQDAMLKLWACHDELHDAGHARNLSRIVVRHLAVDLLRHKKRATAIVVPIGNKTGDWQLPDKMTSRPDSRVEAEENERWLNDRMARLPSREMQVMQMRQNEQKTNDEIARIMGIEPTSVATMLSAARRKIFEDLKKRNRQ